MPRARKYPTTEARLTQATCTGMSDREFIELLWEHYRETTRALNRIINVLDGGGDEADCDEATIIASRALKRVAF